MLNERELKKVTTIEKVLSREITKQEASLELGLSIRQVNRLLLKYQQEGKESFAHKNRGKISEKKISEQKKNEIINLYMSEYSDYNFTHFYEETSDQLNISYITIFRVLNRDEIISPEAQHKTVKLYNDNMKKAIKDQIASEEEIALYEERQKLEEEKHVRRSTALYNYGQEIQMDATLYIWFGDIATMLHLAVDKATKKVLAGWFDYQETSNAYYILLWNIVIHFGIPKLIKTDKRGCFSINNAKHTKSNLNITQFGRICADLGIQLRSCSDPLFKSNVERENRTFKGRLKAELRHENITTIEEANRYLNEVFIPKINSRFSYDIKESKNDMKENPYTEDELNIIISERYSRTIDNASSLKYKNDYYVPVEPDTGEIVSYSKKTECTVVIAFDGSYWCYIEEKLYMLLKIEKYQEEVPKEVKNKNSYKGHKPAENHPWRNYKN